MSAHEIVVVGASAGGVEALTQLISGLPPDFAAAMFVVLHTSPESPGTLPHLLARKAEVPVIAARDAAPIKPGHIYIAQPNFHLELERGRMCLGGGPTENRHRPAIDPLFRSAARYYGKRVIGVLLSGYLDDGVAGLVSIKQRGGLAVVQSPEDALVPDMPQAALEQDHVDYSVPVEEIPALLVELVTGITGAKRKTMPKRNRPQPKGNDKVSVFTCPECNGTLWEVDEQGLLQFRCRVGHKFSPDSMADAQSQYLDRALWAALRALEEHAELSRRLAERAQRGHHPFAARRFEERWRASSENAKVLRDMLTKGELGWASAPAPDKPQDGPKAA